MKSPKDPSDPFDRHNAAGAATVIIGETSNNSAPTALVNVESGAARGATPAGNASIADDPGRTRILTRFPTSTTDGQKTTEPVVGWLVILDGPGKGNHRPIFYGSNTIGRNSNQRIALDFGDDAISGEQQAYLVYDDKKRQFQLVPNLGRQNLVHLNGSALLSNTELKSRDRIMMGRTEILFVPLCGPEFDWSDMK